MELFRGLMFAMPISLALWVLLWEVGKWLLR